MGLETLLEAAKYLEYRAEVEARGEKGDLPSNGSSAPTPASVIQNGYMNHNAIIPNGLHYVSPTATKFKSTSPINTSAGFSRVPEPLNGYKISDHSYRRTNSTNHSPTFDYNGGTNRISKSALNGNGNGNGSGNSLNNTLHNRNSGTREVHNKLEKNRRAHLKECFEMLKSQLPAFEDRKISNLAILRSSLRHIHTLKRKEREFEQEMERLAREKISLQQRLSNLKKDMLGKWDMWCVAEDQDVEYEQNGFCNDSGNSDDRPLDCRQQREESESNGPTNLHQPPKIELSPDIVGDSQHPLSVTISNCHLGGKYEAAKKLYGHMNGVNGIGNGPISLVTTTKLSSSPLAAITVEKTASSPIGGATFNGTIHNSGKGFSVLNSSAVPVHNLGQYYDEKMCK